MMLVRTDAGYQPAAVRPDDRFVWDQPLHPDREQTPVEAPPARQPTDAASHANGNGSGTSNGTRPAAQAAPVSEPAAAPPVEEEIPAPAPRVAQPQPADPRPLVVAAPASDEGVRVSKKAVVVGIALALGLPLSGTVFDLGDSRPEASRAPAVAPADAPAGPVRPARLTVARSGFTQVSKDAVRYAVVIGNANRGFAARRVVVSIAMVDARGRLIGTAVERLAAVPAASSVGVAGQTGVSGRVSGLRASVSVGAFDSAGSVRRFVVRGARMERRGGNVVVRASVSGQSAVRDARLVVVYLDRSGKVLGGDFGYIDVPAAPRTVSAVVETTNVSRAVTRMAVYVIAPR